MASPAPRVGGTLAHYMLLEEVGSGGMGVVYRARDLRLKRDVALKVLAAGLLHDEASRRRFRKEAEALSRFSHANIAHIYDFDTQDGLDFLVMEFVAGEVLSSLVAKGPLPEAEVVNIGCQVASALNEAHDVGIVHRDIKTANLILTPKQQVKLLDFGLAQIVRTHETSTTVDFSDDGGLRGTLPYMAPEQLDGALCTPSSDIYSLGVVLYELSTGRLPFQNSARRALMNEIAEKQPESPSKLRPGLSPVLHTAIVRCLKKRPEERYQSCADLEAALAGQGTTARLFNVSSRRTLFRRLAILLVLIVAAVGIGLLVHRRKPAVPPTSSALKQLAVLPLIASGTSPQAAAFDNGLIETLTSRLARLSSKHPLSVVPASEMRAKHIASLDDANREFGANLALELSVEQAGDMVRVNYALVDVKQHRQIDGDTITAPANDPFSLEDRVSESVVKALELKLEPEEQQELLAGAETQQPAAYDFYLQGRGYLQDFNKLSNIDSGIAEFSHAIESDPNYGLAYAGLGEAYWRKYRATQKQELAERAQRTCHKAVALAPNTAAGYYCLALIEHGTGRYNDAIFHYQMAIKIEPSDSRSYSGLASAYGRLGNDKAAETAFRDGIHARPSDWLPYDELGAFYLNHGNFEGAAAMFKQVVALIPDSYAGYSNLGAAYLGAGKFDTAISYLHRSVDMQATGENTSNLATAYFQVKEYAQAARTYEKSVEISPENYELWGNLGDAYYWAPGERGKAPTAYGKAVELAKRQLKINPQDKYALAYIAQYLAMMGRGSEALVYLERAEKAGPKDATSLISGAIVYAQIGQSEKAIDYLQKAVATGASISDLRETPNFDTLRSSPRFSQLLGLR